MAIFSSKPAASPVKTKPPILTADEARRLAALEDAVEAGLPHVQAMVEAGKALAEIKDRQLYRATAPSFAVYLRSRWGMTAKRAVQMIQFAGLVAVVEDIVGEAAPDLTERALRPLAGMPAEDARQAITEAAASADGLTPATISKAASRRKPRKAKAPRPVRFRLPGGIVVVTVNRAGMKAGLTVEAVLEAAIDAVRRDASQAAA